jgi:hypothetical protein
MQALEAGPFQREPLKGEGVESAGVPGVVAEGRGCHLLLARLPERPTNGHTLLAYPWAPVPPENFFFHLKIVFWRKQIKYSPDADGKKGGVSRVGGRNGCANHGVLCVRIPNILKHKLPDASVIPAFEGSVHLAPPAIMGRQKTSAKDATDSHSLPQAISLPQNVLKRCVLDVKTLHKKVNNQQSVSKYKKQEI